MVGRVAGHEIIQHRLFSMPAEGISGRSVDITVGIATASELRAPFTTRFNVSPLTAGRLRSLCKQ
jgi:hypothetical protein